MEFGVDYVHHVSQKSLVPLEGEGWPAIALPPLLHSECPTEFAIESTRTQSFGSQVKLTARLIAVDGPLNEIIETLEPNVHQFWPIKIMMPNGDTYSRQYYGLRIGQHLDSFLPFQSDSNLWTSGAYPYHVFSFPKKHCAILAMSKDVIGSAHLWREVRLKPPDIYFSDTLANAILDLRLKTPKILKLKVSTEVGKPTLARLQRKLTQSGLMYQTHQARREV